MFLGLVGSSGDTSGECTVEAEGDVGEHNEGMCRPCSGEQHDFGV